MANASREDHLRYFTVFVTTLIGDFARYLQQDGPLDLLADGVGYREALFYLSDAELIEAATALNRVLLPYLANGPAPGRRRRLFATILYPDIAPEEPKRDADPPAEQN
jgi:hypothetical protein